MLVVTVTGRGGHAHNILFQIKIVLQIKDYCIFNRIQTTATSGAVSKCWGPGGGDKWELGSETCGIAALAVPGGGYAANVNFKFYMGPDNDTIQIQLIQQWSFYLLPHMVHGLGRLAIQLLKYLI